MPHPLRTGLEECDQRVDVRPVRIDLDDIEVDPPERLIARVGKSLVGRRASYIAGTSRQLITEYGFDEGRFAGVPKGAVYCGIDTRRFTGDQRDESHGRSRTE